MSVQPLPPSVIPAELNWRDGVPESRQFGDVYFSRDNGLEETRHVFLKHNRLAERFSRLRPGQSFVIAESGFGTGLNFLATWQAWRNASVPQGACLHFVSVERFPLAAEDLAKALSYWPELEELAKPLQQHYPPLVSGLHRIVLDGGRVRLSLYFGDALEGWQDMVFCADAWFLDGFAPALNPELWMDSVVEAVRRHSKPGTTLATFTAVGRVRRAFADAGFTMAKVPGYGRKREMLAGHLPGADTSDPATPEHVLIIGAGIAGCLLARNLAGRGYSVTIADAGNGPGSGASGNTQGALYVKLGVECNAQTHLGLSSLLFSQGFYGSFGGDAWHPTGLLQLAFDDKEADRQRRFLQANGYPADILRPVTAGEASRLSGLALDTSGLWFPHSGWLEPARLCQLLLQHANIQKRFGFRAHRLTPCNGQWHISGNGEQDLVAGRVVLAAGHQTPALIPVRGHFRLKAIRGQVTRIPEARINAPRVVICGRKYLNPAHGGYCLTGATFDLHNPSPELSIDSHRENLEQLEAMVPGIWSQGPPDMSALEGRAAFRCTTHDYQPVAGELKDAGGRPLAGVDILTGLGSKGLSYGPLLAEYLADCISGQPRALPSTLARRLMPERCHTRKRSLDTHATS